MNRVYETNSLDVRSLVRSASRGGKWLCRKAGLPLEWNYEKGEGLRLSAMEWLLNVLVVACVLLVVMTAGLGLRPSRRFDQWLRELQVRSPRRWVEIGLGAIAMALLILEQLRRPKNVRTWLASDLLWHSPMDEEKAPLSPASKVRFFVDLIVIHGATNTKGAKMKLNQGFDCLNEKLGVFPGHRGAYSQDESSQLLDAAYKYMDDPENQG